MKKLSLLFALLIIASCNNTTANKDVKSISANEVETSDEVAMKINTDSSSLKWVGKEITTSQHYGSLMFESGELNVCSNTNSEQIICNGYFIVDMTSLTVEDLTGGSKQKLEGHLKSDDFFSIEKHTKAKLTIEGSKIIDSGFLVDGSLTIKDITHPIQFEMVKDIGGYVANLVFDRSKYDVRFRSGSFFENLGDKLILDEIELTANLYFQ